MASKKYAILTDIHGNLEALNKSLSIINQQKDIEKIIFLGDYFSLGPAPVEVFNILSNMPIETVFIRGNHERYLIEKIWTNPKPKIEGMNLNDHVLNGIVKHQKWVFDQIGAKLFEFIEKRTKISYNETIGSNHLEFSHAWFERDERAPSKHEARKLSDKYLNSNKNIKSIIFVHGHIHIERNDKHKNFSIYCPTSTGLPFDKVVKGSIGYLEINDDISFKIERFDYDFQKTIDLLNDRKPPFYKNLVQTVKFAEIRNNQL
ncbi:MAG: hypothetical protein CMG48_02900 [Candidatus Marinimicrobia bacterium]|nr:hypothetical protein [Candidatus Neomarinimicrobiota bacterium]